MFVVEKVARGHRYLYLVESIREPGGRVRQRILQPLGRKDILVASSALERLLQSIGRHCERSLILSEIAAGTIACRRIGAPLLFGRLWERLGIAECCATNSPAAASASTWSGRFLSPPSIA